MSSEAKHTFKIQDSNMACKFKSGGGQHYLSAIMKMIKWTNFMFTMQDLNLVFSL